jgi:hypothetical protein
MRQLSPLRKSFLFRTALICCTAIAVLVVWSASARRVGPAVVAATIVGLSSATLAAAVYPTARRCALLRSMRRTRRWRTWRIQDSSSLKRT